MKNLLPHNPVSHFLRTNLARSCKLWLLVMIILRAGSLTAQQTKVDCTVMDTLFHEDFGGTGTAPDVPITGLPVERTTFKFNPNGKVTMMTARQYLLTKTSNTGIWRFNGVDHTVESIPARAGYFMAINSDSTTDPFYTQQIDNLCPGSVLNVQLAVTRLLDQTVRPAVKVEILLTDNTTVLVSKSLPLLSFTGRSWLEQGLSFRMPPNVTSVILRLSMATNLPAGNEVGIDDIVISRCSVTPTSSINDNIGSPVLLCPQSRVNIAALPIPIFPVDNQPFITAPTYQWSYRENATGTFTDLPGETNPTLIIPNISAFKNGTGGEFRYSVKSGTNGNAACVYRSTPQTVGLTNFNFGISVTPASVQEGNMFTYTVTANSLLTQAINVGVSLSGTAVSGRDYNVSGLTPVAGSPGAFTISMPNGSSSAAFTVNTVRTPVIKSPKTVIATLVKENSDPCVSSFTTPTATGTITPVIDPNSSVVQIIAVTPTVTEGPGAKAVYRVQFRDPQVTAESDVTLNYAMSGTAQEVVDFVKPSGTIVLPKDSNGVFLFVDIVDNGIIQGPRTLTGTLTTVNQPVPGATFTVDPAQATVQILDDPASGPVLSIVKKADAAEPATNGSFTVSLPPGKVTNSDIPINFSIDPASTAKPGIDYAPITGPFVLRAGSNSIDIPVIVIDNKVVDGTRTVIMNLGNSTAGNGLQFTVNPAAASATVNILDDETNDPNNLRISIAAVRDAIEGGTNGEFRVSLPPGITASTDIQVNFTVSSGGNHAVPGVHYEPIIRITIPAGSNEVRVPVVAIVENKINPPLTVELTLANSNDGLNNVYTPDPAAARASLLRIDRNADPSTRPLSVIKVLDAKEPSTNGLFRVSIPAPLVTAEAITVSFQMSGTAVEDVDYKKIVSVVIPADSNGVDVPVEVIDNRIIQPTRTAIMTLQGGSSTSFTYVVSATEGSATVNIEDDDGIDPNNTRVQVKAGKDGAKPSTNGSFMVSLPAGYTASADLTLQFTMSGTAVQNTDYTIGQVVIPAGQNSVEVPVVVINNKVLTGTRTVVMQLTGVNQPIPGATFSVDPRPDTIRIIDSAVIDGSARVILEAVPGEDIAQGPNGVGRMRVRFADPDMTSATDITVSYDVSGTAVPVNRYEALPGTVTIPAGQKEAFILVKAVPSNVVRPVETVVATLTQAVSPAGGFTLPAVGRETVRILDAFDQKNLDIAIVKVNDATIKPLTNGLFRVKYAANDQLTASEDVTVTYTVSGTAVAGTDYQPLPGTVTIPKGSNGVDLPVVVIDQKVLNEATTVIVALQNATQPIAGVTMNAAGRDTVKIPARGLGPDPTEVEARKLCIRHIADAFEGGANGRFEIGFVDRDIKSARPIRVRFNIQGSNAFPGKDYEPVSAEDGVIVLPAMQNSVIVELKVIDDNIAQLLRQAVFNLESVESPFPGVPFGIGDNGCGSTTINITDNDTVKVRIERRDTVIKEGDTARFIVRVLNDVVMGGPVQLKIAYHHDEDRRYTLDGNDLAVEGMINKVINSDGEIIDVVSVKDDTHQPQGFIGLKLLEGDVVAGMLPYKIVDADWQDVLVNDTDTLEVKWAVKRVSRLEGNSLAYEPMAFVITMNHPSSRDVRVRFVTKTDEGIRKIQRAIPRSLAQVPFLIDYDNTATDSVLIRKGSLSDTVFIPVMGDLIYELDEQFIVAITDASIPGRNGVRETVAVGEREVTGVIVNDDTFDCAGDYDYDGIPNWKEVGFRSLEECTGSNGPTNLPDTDDDGVPDYLDSDSDDDGVPDSVEGWIKDDRWRNNNKGLIRVHPAVSPNRDGKGNDCMYIENIRMYPDNEVVVFNRWGDIVYKVKGYTNGDVSFCGTGNYGGANNKEVPDGVYYYVVRLNNVTGQSRYTGYIVIKR